MSESGKRGYKEAKDRRDRRDDHGGRDDRGRDDRRDRDRGRRGDRRRSRSRSRSPLKKKAAPKTKKAEPEEYEFPAVCWICDGSLFQEIKHVVSGTQYPVKLKNFMRREMRNKSFFDEIRGIYGNNLGGVACPFINYPAPTGGITLPSNEAEHAAHVSALYHFLAGQYTADLERDTNLLLKPRDAPQPLPPGLHLTLGSSYEEYVIKLTEKMNNCYGIVFNTSHTTCNQIKNSVDLWSNSPLQKVAKAQADKEGQFHMWGVVRDSLFRKFLGGSSSSSSSSSSGGGGAGAAPPPSGQIPSPSLAKRLIEEIVKGSGVSGDWIPEPSAADKEVKLAEAEKKRLREGKSDGGSDSDDMSEDDDDAPLGEVGNWRDNLDEDIGEFFVWAQRKDSSRRGGFAEGGNAARNSIFRNNVIRYKIGYIYSKIMEIVIPKIQVIIKRRIKLPTLRFLRQTCWEWAEEIFIFHRTLYITQKIQDIFECIIDFEKYSQFFLSRGKKYEKNWKSAEHQRAAANLRGLLEKKAKINKDGLARLASVMNATPNFAGILSKLKRHVLESVATEGEGDVREGSGSSSGSSTGSPGTGSSQAVAGEIVDNTAEMMLDEVCKEFPGWGARFLNACKKGTTAEIQKEGEKLPKSPSIRSVPDQSAEEWKCPECGKHNRGDSRECVTRIGAGYRPPAGSKPGQEVTITFRYLGPRRVIVPPNLEDYGDQPLWFDTCPGRRENAVLTAAAVAAARRRAREQGAASGAAVARSVSDLVPPPPSSKASHTKMEGRRSVTKAKDEARRGRGFWVDIEGRKKFILEVAHTVDILYEADSRALMFVPKETLIIPKSCNVRFRKKGQAGGRKTRRKRRKKRTRRRRKMRRKRTLRGRRRKRQRKKRRTRRKK